MFNFCSLYSGSSGNSLLVQTANTKILIDAGESAKKIVEALSSVNIDVNDLDAIIVTHEHSDHVKGLGTLSKKYNIPVYANKKTWDAMPEQEAKILDINGPGRELPIKVYLFQGLPKGDKMETVIQKMVELGVYGIVPVSTKRSIVKLDAKKVANKVKRWNAISESAAKQSKRGIIPRVNDVCTFKQAIDMAKELDMIIMPYEEADDMEKTRNIIRGLKKDTSVGIFIGPEGGFAKEEVNAVMEENGTPITLGKRILRTETAGMAIMSVIMFMMEE